MQLMNRIRKRPLVTVCWLDREVSMALWFPEGTGYRCCRVARRVEGQCDADGYLEALQELTPGRKSARVEVRWIILREAWPASEVTGRRSMLTLALPGWIRRCWEQLDPVHLEIQVVSGMDLLESALRDHQYLQEPGSAFLMRIGGRFLLIGRGAGEEGFRRISRRDLVNQGCTGSLCREWLLQTRSLFRNRTGLELKRVHVAKESGIYLEQEPEFPMEICPTQSLTFPGIDNSVFPASACGLLHGAGTVFGGSRGGSLELSAISQRQRWHRWERRLRLSTCLLLGCWGFLFLGACRNEAIIPEMGLATAREWQRHESDLKERQERWQRVWSEKQEAAKPFDLIARVIRDRPDGVSVNRIRVESDASRGEREMSVQLEGTFSGKAAHPGFRKWIEGLRHSNPIDLVKNLEFAREGEGIAFTLEGDVQDASGGGR